MKKKTKRMAVGGTVRSSTPSSSGSSNRVSASSYSTSRGGSSGPSRGASKPSTTASKPSSSPKSSSKPSSKPSSPMSGQGTSYKSPVAAKKANDQFSKTFGFANRVNKANLPSAMSDIKDIRKMTGPYNANDPKYYDPALKRTFNPNNPLTKQQLNKKWSDYRESKAAKDFKVDRSVEQIVRGKDTRSPGERSADVAARRERDNQFNKSLASREMDARKQSMQPMSSDPFRNRQMRSRLAGDVRLPDVRLPSRSGFMSFGSFAKGGVVRKKKR